MHACAFKQPPNVESLLDGLTHYWVRFFTCVGFELSVPFINSGVNPVI